MSKQTAVEYLIEQLLPKALSEEQYYHIEKAKAMEKEQIMEAYLTSLSNEYWFQKDEILNQESEKYYNETYGGDE
jgi:hypothetical protein